MLSTRCPAAALLPAALQFDLITASPGGAVLLHDGIW